MDDKNMPAMAAVDRNDGNSRLRHIQSSTEITIGVEFLKMMNVSTFALCNIFKFANRVSMNATLTMEYFLKFGVVKKNATTAEAMH